jgi:hypothetical protein
VKAPILIFFLIFTIRLFGQDVDLAGAIVIGNSNMVTYKLVYQVNDNNTISGYSITDIGGNFETKANIKGVYNPSKKLLRYEETSIISSKADLPATDFCLMKVKGKFSKQKDLFLFTGSFESKSANSKVKCDTGTMYLTTTLDIFRIEEKVQKILASSNTPDSIKAIVTEKIKPLKTVEQSAVVKAGSITEYVLLSDTIKIEVFDDQKQDGDRITVLKNNIPVLTDFLTTNLTQELKFGIDKKEKNIIFTIISTNEGASPPTTVKLRFVNGYQKINIVAPLRKAQLFKVKFVRK